MRIIVATGTNVKPFQDCGLRIVDCGICKTHPVKHQIPCLPAGRQAPNPKQIPMTKISNLKRNRFGDLTFGNYLKFEICDLEFHAVWFQSRAKS
jgi:hypothetical protein